MAEALQAQLAAVAQENARLTQVAQQQQAALESATQKQQQLLAQLQQHQANQPAPSANVFKVSVKLPAFWTEKPNVWFAQADEQFRLASITSETTMYSHVVAGLCPRVAAEVEDIITGPPTDRTYTKLKETLIKRLSMSEEKRVQQLINNEELGDRKPSQFLRHLRSLAGSNNTVSESLLKQLWMQRLPATVSAILASQADMDLGKLADLADRIVEVTPAATAPPLAVHAVQTPALAGFEELMKTVQNLSLQVAALTKGNGQQPFRQRSRSRSRGGNKSGGNNNNGANNNNNNGDVCWYHRKFAAQATKCTAPCSFSSGNSSGSA